MKTRAAVGTVLFLAWLAVTYYAPTWPTGWVLGACGAVVLGANGGRPNGKLTAGWVTTGPPAIAAAAGTAAWVVIGEALTYPAPSEWGRWIASAVGIVWVVCIIAGSVWDGGPTRRRRPRGKATPLREALAAAGIPALAIPDDGRHDPVRVSRGSRVGLGTTYRVQLPAGVITSDLAGRASRVAGNLNLAETDLSIEPGRHASEAVVWVGDRGAGTATAGLWPGIAEYPERSCLEPISVGLDRFGRDVEITLAGGSGVLIGSLPGKGKSSTMNLLLAAVLADERASAVFLDFKGGNDFTAWKECADDFYCGDPSADPEEVLRILRGVRAAIDTRFGRLPHFKVSKIDERIACEHGMGPVVLVIDEAHELLGKGSSVPAAARDEAIGIVKTIIARGRAVNVWLLIASQRVTDDEIPSSITQRITSRIAYRLSTQPASQAVLGPDAWAAGYRATRLAAPGVGYLVNEDGDITHLRSWYVPDDADFAEVPQDRPRFPDHDGCLVGRDAEGSQGRLSIQYRLAGLAAKRRPARSVDTGEPTPTIAVTAALPEAADAPEPPAATGGFAGWGRPGPSLQELHDRHREEAEFQRLRAERAAAVAAEFGDAVEVEPATPQTAAGASVADLVELVEDAWPTGQRGPLRAAWLSVLADAAGVDEAWLAGELERVGAPVESVRMSVEGGAKRWGVGLSRERLEGWAHPHVALNSAP